ncbi:MULTISPECIES: PLP-dependent transferase [Corynebacterium]|nr:MULTISPECIES: PLP-dependent transferase [Corynebacterium]
MSAHDSHGSDSHGTHEFSGFDTAAIHAGWTPDQHMGSINVPIWASTTFAQNAPNDLRGGFEYARVANPTVASLAQTLTRLEGGRYGRVFASGMAATDILLRALLLPGDHVIIGHDAYGGTYRLLNTFFREWGVELTVVDTTDVDAVAGALQENTKVVWLETPTNPLMAVTDIQAVAERVKAHNVRNGVVAEEAEEAEGIAGVGAPGEGAVNTANPANAENPAEAADAAGAGENASPVKEAQNLVHATNFDAIIPGAQLIVDNTFASPYLQRPLEQGADVVLHSTTKYIGGHSDVVGGAVICNNELLDQKLDFLLGGVGPVASPFDAYLAARGVKTLGVRMERHSSNALAIAEYLSGRPEVKEVLYPGLETHPGHEVAAKQSTGKGFGGMMSVRFHNQEAALKFCMSTKLICLAESLGGVESLLEHPGTMTHQSVKGSQLEVPDDLVRISVGIEDINDLLADVEQALAQL